MTPIVPLLTWQPAAAGEWLVTSPLFGLTATMAAYALGRWLHARTGNPLLQPVLVAIVVVSAVLLLADIDYADYLTGGVLIGFWLGPATVALALPLHHEWERIRTAALPVGVAVITGATAAIVTAIGVTAVTGGDRALQMTMAPKSATTPVSIAIAEQIGGIPALTAIVTIITGILGAMVGPWLLDRCGITDLRARGVALGSSAHGVGTSRALLESRTEGAFSAVAMGLTAVATSVLVPLVLLLL